MQKNNERKTFADKGENLKFWDKYLFERKCLPQFIYNILTKKKAKIPQKDNI